MKSQALQEFVSKVFGDEKTRSQFLADPGSLLSGFKLTETEKRAVLSSHAKLGLVTSGSMQLEAVLKPTLDWSAPAQ